MSTEEDPTTQELRLEQLKRAVRLGEPSGSPRISDLGALLPATTGKLELETLGDDAPEERIVDRLLSRALLAVFVRRVDEDQLDEVVDAFESGLEIETGDAVPSREYVRWVRETRRDMGELPLEH